MGTPCQCGATMYRMCCLTGYATQHPGYMEYASQPCQCMLSVTCQGISTLCRVCDCTGCEYGHLVRLERNKVPCQCAMVTPFQWGDILYRICCPTGYATQDPGDMGYASRPCQCMLFVTCQEWIPCAGYVAVQAVHIHALPGWRGTQYQVPCQSVPC